MNLTFIEKTETLITQFCVINYITSEFNIYEKNETLLVYFWVITYITGKFCFSEKKHLIDPILDNNLHN